MLRNHAGISTVLMLIVIAGFSSTASADESGPPQVSSRIESVGLFKHGLAVVRRKLTLPGPGVYDLTDLPEPIHGTFWVESAANLAITMTEADVPTDAPAGLPGMTNASLAGCTVQVRFKEEHLPPVEGVVLAPDEQQKTWNQSYGWSQPRHGWWWSGYNQPYRGRQIASSPSLVVESETGQMVIDSSTIASISIINRPTLTTVRRPVMRLHVRSDEANSPNGDQIEVSLLYLAKGASWAPSYSVDISDPEGLQFRQKAVIRNELEDWKDVELLLITGVPSVEFGHVLSPISPATNLATFFRALGTHTGLSYSSRSDVMSQMVMSNRADYEPTADAAFADTQLTGIDLQYHSIGRWSLGEGETLMVETAHESASYERIVRWTVPDTRDRNGRARNTWDLNYEDEKDHVAWDAIRLKNPMDRPMTTAPIMVAEDGLVKGQQMVSWTAPQQEVTVPINQALSVITRFAEYEIEKSRKEITYWARRCYKSDVRGVLEMTNHRSEPITMVIHRDFSGDLVEADENPHSVLLGEGARQLNPRRRLIWTLELEPGEHRVLNYTYQAITPW